MRSFLAGTLLVVVLFAAGCGGGSPANSNGEASKPAQQVVNDASNAAKAASTVRISASRINVGGQDVGIDMTVVKGKGATGTVTFQGHNVDLVVIGSDAYMKTDATVLAQFGGKQGAAIAPLVAGKWLKFSASNPKFAKFTEFADASGLFDALATSHGTLKNNGETTFQGQSVVEIADTTQNAQLEIAATGTPYPVALVKPGANGGTVTFDKWNESVTLTPPSDAIDLTSLGG